jgi:hypothetical protein
MSGDTERHQWNKDSRLKKQLCLRSERTSGRIFRKTSGLEIVRRIAGSSIRIPKMSVRTL